MSSPFVASGTGSTGERGLLTMTVAAPAAEVRARGLARWRPRRLGLRARITLTFALGALLLSMLLAGTTYFVTRSALIRQRETAIQRQAEGHAVDVQNDLKTTDPDVSKIVLRIGKPFRPIVVWKNSATAFFTTYSLDVVPDALENKVARDGEAARMRVKILKEPQLVVGIPLPQVGAQYYEIVSLTELGRSLRSIALVLLGASTLTTALGAVAGMSVSGRAVKPLADAARAAEAIAGGRLDTRLEAPDDPDLASLTTAFNDMALALEERVERDARFASDVSHELRSPLMTLSASAEVLQSRRDELPERAAAALDLLVADVSRFQGLVEDLLEISRFDAGAVRLHLEEVNVAQFVRAAVAVSDSGRGVVVEVADAVESATVRADKRRLARVIANLLDNARFHGGGASRVSVELPDEQSPATVLIAVEDDGSGVPVDERKLVFERFSRGAGAGRRSATEGAGLGLALVDEHVRLHRGRVWVEDRTDGRSGARFVIELPVVS
jgi:two-component system, OmpR family, sensor histidine kinase MtrB